MTDILSVSQAEFQYAVQTLISRHVILKIITYLCIATCFSGYCLREFKKAYHHNVMVMHKKRLIVLMMLRNLTDLGNYDADDIAVLRQYLRQYTYIDYTTDDWLDKLLYALPLHGLLQHNEDPDHDVQVQPNQDRNDDALLEHNEDRNDDVPLPANHGPNDDDAPLLNHDQLQ